VDYVCIMEGDRSLYCGRIRDGEGMVKSADELMWEVEALRDRISNLSGAVLRSSASLDVDTVLQEIAENARAQTGARGAVIHCLRRRGADRLRDLRPDCGRGARADRVAGRAAACGCSST